MCYSAQLKAEFRTYVRHGGELAIDEFARLYGHTFDFPIYIPRAVDRWFEEMPGPEAAQIREQIATRNKQNLENWERELFKQRKRLADAERILADKPTKKAENDKRIATNKVSQLLARIDDAKRTELASRDSRIFPLHWAPVIAEIDGKRQILPMRYGCRPAGKPAFYDKKYPGTYNARRDNLEGFWKGQFGKTHGIAIVSAFYENVERDGKNAVLKFRPQDGEDMLVACLWSRWTKPGEEDLLSFAAITDEPPAEVAAAGHDRCIVPIRAANVDAWLRGGTPEEMYRILDDRVRPYYEHKLAA